MNPNKPLWTRPISNITDQEYKDFYKSFSRDSSDPMAHIHFQAEGDVEFRSLLYIPSKAPPNHLNTADAHIRSIKLFVRRVFITDELLDFIPKYLGFLKGLVDSDDLPLNVSRETLQQHRLLKMMRRKVVTKALEMIAKLAEDETKYEEFLKEFSTNMKLGVIEDSKNRKKLIKLLRFRTSFSEKRTSLDDYLKRMKKGQSQIYLLTGPSLEEIKKSPFVELVIARGYEVLYLDEPIDEYVLQNVHEYEKKSFQNVAKEGLKFGDESEKTKEKVEELTKKFKPLTDYLTNSLNKFVEKVEISTRLTSSPSAIVASQFGWSGNMERLMNSQALGNNDDPMRSFMATQKKTLEINPRHPLVNSMLAKVEAKETDGVDELAKLLYEITAIRSGYLVKDTMDFANRIERVIRLNLGVDPTAQVNSYPQFSQSNINYDRPRWMISTRLPKMMLNRKTRTSRSLMTWTRNPPRLKRLNTMNFESICINKREAFFLTSVEC
jgi:heat shock protein beta